MTESEIFDAIYSAMNPERFVALGPLRLTWDEIPHEELHWEIFQGRLLGASMTRERRSFRAWNVRGIMEGKATDEPLVSIKRDAHDGKLYVTRGLLCYGHRPVATGNVIETKEDVFWSRELVGSLDPREFSAAALKLELCHLVFAAVVGTGQLPLTSLEAPLPEFALGRLGYLPGTDHRRYTAKHFEVLLRSEKPISEIATRWPAADSLSMLRDVFLGVSLSPYTDFVGRSLALLREWEARQAITIEQRIDFLGWLIRLQWRHLNAYDLFLFHHRGANYPDALLVDETLRELLTCVASNPSLFFGDLARLRRRALRWGWFLRAIYEGHRVPQQPTSPGENARVLPTPWVHLNEDEILNPYRRSKELFREPLTLSSDAEELLRRSIEELIHEYELRELGTALILDRPLGWSKSVGEPDLTPILAYVARSRKLALRHVEHLEKRGMPYFLAGFAERVRREIALLDISGVPLSPLNRPARPGVLSLGDSFQTSDDFVIDRATRRSVDNFRSAFDWSAIGNQTNDSANWRIILPVWEKGREVNRVFDNQLVPWLTLEIDSSAGFRTRAGVELPIRGMRAKVNDGDPVVVPPN